MAVSCCGDDCCIVTGCCKYVVDGMTGVRLSVVCTVDTGGMFPDETFIGTTRSDEPSGDECDKLSVGW